MKWWCNIHESRTKMISYMIGKWPTKLNKKNLHRLKKKVEIWSSSLQEVKEDVQYVLWYHLVNTWKLIQMHHHQLVILRVEVHLVDMRHVMNHLKITCLVIVLWLTDKVNTLVIAQRKILQESMRDQNQKGVMVAVQLNVQAQVSITRKVLNNGTLKIILMLVAMEKPIINLQQLVKEIKLKTHPSQDHHKLNTLPKWTLLTLVKNKLM